MDGITRDMTYTVATCDLGALLVAATDRGLCHVELHDTEADAVEAIGGHAPDARLVRDDSKLRPLVDEVLHRVAGRAPEQTLPLDVHGTEFQRAVWGALAQIPRGEVRTYGEVAEAIGAPRAVRAVGSACGANPIAVVVPCHRVVRAGGDMGSYAGGPQRKRELLRREGAPVLR